MPNFLIETPSGDRYLVEDVPSAEAGAERLKAAGLWEPRPSTAGDVATQAGRGVVEGLADLTNLAELAQTGARAAVGAVGLDPRLVSLLPGFARPEMQRDPETQRLVEAPGVAQGLREFGEERFGEAQTPGGIAARGFARGVTGTLPTLPLGGGARPVVAAIETLAGGAGGTAAEFAEEAGAGPLGQFAAAVPASLGVSGIGRGIARSAIREGGEQAAQVAAQEAAERAAASAVGEGAERLTRAGARRLAAATGRASSELRRRIGDEEIVSDAVQRLDEGIEAFPDPRARPGTAAMLSSGTDPLGGQNLPAMEGALARTDVDFSTELSNQLIRSRRLIQNDLDHLRPEGDFDTFLNVFDDTVDAAAQAERSLWNQVPFEDVPRFNPSRLLSRADEITREATEFGAANIPPEFEIMRQVWGEGAQGDMRQLQALRSQLLRRSRAGKLRTATAEAQAQGALASQLLDDIRSVTDELAGAGAEAGEAVTALGMARNATRANRELFDVNSGVIQAIESGGTAKNLIGNIMRARGRRGARTTPVREARRVMRILGDNQEGVDSLRRAFLDDVFGEEVSDMTARAMRKQLNRNQDVAREILGDELFMRSQEFLRRVATVKFGQAGTPGAAFRTGSNLPVSEIALGAAEAAVTPFGGERLMRELIRRVGKDELQAAILRSALLDPQLARDLLAAPAARATPAWAARVTQGLTRNGIIPPAMLRAAGEMTGEAQ